MSALGVLGLLGSLVISAIYAATAQRTLAFVWVAIAAICAIVGVL